MKGSSMSVPMAAVLAVSGAARAQVGGSIDAVSGLERAGLSAQVETAPWNALQLGLAARYGSNWSTDGARATDFEVSAALHRRIGAGGVWLGTRTFNGIHAGVWQPIGSAFVSVAIHDRSSRVVGERIAFREVTVLDSLLTDSGWTPVSGRRMVADSSLTSQARRWSELEARVEWSPLGPGRLVLGLSVISGLLPWGPMNDSLSRAGRLVWGSTTAVLPILPRLALFASVGTDPSLRDPQQRSRFFTLGLRWTPAALAVPALPVHGPRSAPLAEGFAVTPDSGDRYTVSVRASHAKRVDIAGDFSNWKPVALQPAASQRWQVALPLAPGTYRVNVRVDGGAWIVPAGLPAMDDEFNGRVGLFVVR